MASSSTSSNQAVGADRQSCRHAQARIAAFWAAGLESPETAVWSVSLAIQSLRGCGRWTLKVLQATPCKCRECSRPAMSADHVNLHGQKVLEQKDGVK